MSSLQAGEKGISQVEAGNQVPQTILILLVKILHPGQQLQLESLPDLVYSGL